MYHVALYKEQPHYLLSIFNTSTMAEPKQWRVGQSFSGGVYMVDVDLVKIGQAFSDIELPEVNKIVKGRKFCNLGATSSSTYNAVNVNNTMEDRISKLPDDILQCIISNLTTREGAGTNILSTRWRNLWIKSINSLNFDYANMIGYDYPRNTKFPRFEFTRWVNKIFQLHHGSRLDALRLSLVVNKESFVDVDKWMKLAAAQRVQELDLEFLCGTDISYYASLICGYFPENEYKFPVQAFCSSLKYLHLRYCTFDIPPDFKGFSSLVSMALDSIFLTEYAVQNILSSCSSLEMLSLMKCRFANHTCLKFVGPSLLLKHLHICFHQSFVMVEARDTNLLSLELDVNASMTELSIKNAPHLARLTLAMDVPVEILSGVPHLEILYLAGWFAESTLPESYMFNNLKRLVFIARRNVTLLCQLVYVLEACPMLQSLKLHMGIFSFRKNGEIDNVIDITRRLGSPYTKLKEIEIYGFEGFPEKIELSRYLLRHAIVLEKMKIYTITKEYQGNGKWLIFKNTAKQEGMSLNEVRKLLQKEANSSTELIFVPYN